MPGEIHIVLASTAQRARAKAKQIAKGFPHQLLDLGECNAFEFQDREQRKPSFNVIAGPGQNAAIFCVVVRIG